jgi:hypothetical protein
MMKVLNRTYQVGLSCVQEKSPGQQLTRCTQLHLHYTAEVRHCRGCGGRAVSFAAYNKIVCQHSLYKLTSVSVALCRTMRLVRKQS